MVKVTFILKNSEYVGFFVKGHACFDEEGKDIVCSAISSIVVGGINAIEKLNDFNVKIEKGNVEFSLKQDKEISLNDKIVLKTIRIQLESVRQAKEKYIQIREERIE